MVLDNEVLKKSVIFDDKPQSIPIHHEHKKSKKKHKHRHHKDHHERKRSTKIHKNHRENYTEFINSPIPPWVQQQFIIPPSSMTYHTLELPSQSNTSTPFWFFPM